MEGFNVLVAHDGEQALSLLDDSIDLLLLDVMMPKKNGIDTLKELRQTHQTPVIMLTARGSELDRVLGLELGADDYLPKPFNDRELVARIRAILRRSHWSEQQQNTDNSSPTLEVDSLSLNPGRQEASFDGETLELTGTEFTLLETQYGEGDAAKSQSIAENYITQGVVGIFGCNEGSTTGAGNAIKASGSSEIVGVGFDKSDAILGLIEDGYLLATMAQNPDVMGYEGVKAAVAALNGESLGGAVTDTGVSVLTK